jgi:hypothetical protein
MRQPLANRSQIHETRITQPVLFSLQIALAELWKSIGIVPDFVIGHSFGKLRSMRGWRPAIEDSFVLRPIVDDSCKRSPGKEPWRH